MSPAPEEVGPETEPEADTAAWSSVKLVSEAWDLAEGDGDSHPLTRLEIRRAAKARARQRKRRRAFRNVVLGSTSLVVLGGIAGGAYLAWQRFVELTPARYARDVRPIVNSADSTVGSVQTMVAQVSASEVPNAYQIVEARRAEAGFSSCTRHLAAIAAPQARRAVRAELITGCRDYRSLMEVVTSAGGAEPLIDMGSFNTDLAAADRSWAEGTAAVGAAPVTLSTGGA